MVAITSREDLALWLKGQPRHFAQVIAARVALRVLPLAFRAPVSDTWVATYSLAMFRSCGISWAARNLPAHDMRRFAAAYAADAIWDSISADCALLLEMQGSAAKAAQALSSRQLWLRGEPVWIVSDWKHAKGRLRTLDPAYHVWLSWYDRRIAGKECAFALPRKADEALQIRIFDSDNEWWERGHAAVNADIAAWLAEAEAKTVQEGNPALGAIELPPQNPNSLTFQPSPSGRIAIAFDAGNPELQRDAAAQDRHAEAVDEARRLLSLAEGSNTAQRLVEPLKRYIAALGETIDDLQSGIIAQRGERVRQFLADYEAEAPDPDLDPLPRAVLTGLKSLRSAHNVMMIVDPLLRGIDSALLGPDVKPALIAPEDLKSMAADAEAAGLTEDGIREILEEAASLSPAVPDPQNRRSVWSSEAALNLTIEMLAMVCENPRKTTAGVVIVSTAIAVAPGVTALGVGSFAISFSHWAKKRQEGLLNLLERYPACQSLLREILRQVMPEDKDRKS